MIEVKELSKFYGPRPAIDRLNFSIQPGEIVGFLGPNGAGKSTTMKIVTGFMPATSGTVTVAGFDVFEQSLQVKRNVGYLPETPPLYFEMIVEDFLKFAAKLHDVPASQLKAKVDSALERTGLTQVRKRIIGNLSKGYKQRVGIAQALVHDPKVLILDEPTVGLDPAQIIEIRELIKSLAGQHTVILSSHILQEVTATCQRIIVISKGKIVAQDTIERLTTQINQGVIYGLTVKATETQGIEAIRALKSVAHVDVSGNKLLVALHPDQASERDQIIQAAVNAKMGVLDFALERRSLEEVFLELTHEQSNGVAS